MDEIVLDKLCELIIYAQRIDKDIRSARNKGKATDADVRDAKVALAGYRNIAHRYGIHPIDIDGRAKRKQVRRAEEEIE